MPFNLCLKTIVGQSFQTPINVITRYKIFLLKQRWILIVEKSFGLYEQSLIRHLLMNNSVIDIRQETFYKNVHKLKLN